jgi:hypothetical protein
VSSRVRPPRGVGGDVGIHDERRRRTALLKGSYANAKNSLIGHETRSTAVLSDENVALIESGCALIIGITTADGSPVALRGWGLRVLADHDHDCDLTVRLVVDAVDVTEGHLHEGAAIAVTGADVRTLRSVQLKGRLRTLEDATAADRHTAERFIDDFTQAIEDTDGMPPALTRRMTPAGYAAAVLDITEFYDQTPGPSAGAALDDEATP